MNVYVNICIYIHEYIDRLIHINRERDKDRKRDTERERDREREREIERERERERSKCGISAVLRVWCVKFKYCLMCGVQEATDGSKR